MQGICDITIPCFFHTLFDIHCPGCGLTRAFMSLMKLDFQSAYNYNPLIFIVIPSIIYFIIKDYLNFKG